MVNTWLSVGGGGGGGGVTMLANLCYLRLPQLVALLDIEKIEEVMTSSMHVAALHKQRFVRLCGSRCQQNGG